jgi:excisionase family DNA binding protein
MLTKSNHSGIILTMKKLKELFTVSEIALKIGVTRQAIDKRIKSRRIQFETYGKTRLISKSEMEKVIR